jgi:hypothetical protein
LNALSTPVYSPFCEPGAMAVCGLRNEMPDSSSALGGPCVRSAFAAPVRMKIGTS